MASFDTAIDRYHSVAFSYTAHTKNKDLIELSVSVWDSLPEETRAKRWATAHAFMRVTSKCLYNLEG